MVIAKIDPSGLGSSGITREVLVYKELQSTLELSGMGRVWQAFSSRRLKDGRNH